MSAAPVAIFDPEGTLREVPYEQMTDAVKAGGVPAVQMKGPDGQIRHVPANKIQDASKDGGEMVPFEQQEVKHPGFWHSLVSDLAGMATPGPGGGMSSPYPGVTPESGQLAWKTAMESAESERQAGYSKPYMAAAGVAQGLGVNVPGMEQSAAAGDVAGVAGHAATVPAVLAITKGISKAVPMVKGAAKAGTSYFSGEGIQNDLKGSVKSVAQGIMQESTAQPPPNTPEAQAWHREAMEQAKAKLPNATLSEQLQEAAKIQKAGPTAPDLSGSIRKNCAEAGDAVYAKSKSVYAKIDAATDGKFQSTTNAMKNIDKKLAEVHGINPDQEGNLFEHGSQVEATK